MEVKGIGDGRFRLRPDPTHTHTHTQLKLSITENMKTLHCLQCLILDFSVLYDKTTCEGTRVITNKIILKITLIKISY